jgi:HAMP domain-containing protein
MTQKQKQAEHDARLLTLEERARLRDAIALTMLPHVIPNPLGEVNEDALGLVRQAYRWADLMLRVREE